MKKLFLLGAIISFGFIVLVAQTPKGFNYQAIIRNSQGVLVSNTDVGVRISILQGSTNGAAVFAETFSIKTNSFGLVNLVIGQGEVVSGTFETIDWSTANYFIKVELDAANTNSYVEMGTTQLLSVPYANYAFSGNAGASAYQTWLNIGNTGGEEVFLDSLTGSQGEIGPQGKSAYETWIELGNSGSEEVFMDSLKGPQGQAGLSAYQIWLALGNTGTEADYINSLTGPQGLPGLSAYQVWLSLGNVGTEDDFIKSLTGPSGTSSWLDDTLTVTTNKKVGIGTDNPTAILQVAAPINNSNTEPLFEVKNSSGKTVFAVYENEVKVFLDKGSNGAFTVSSRDTNDVEKELMSVNPAQTTIYVDSSSAKSTRGGFAVSGRTSNKGETKDMLSITNGMTEFFVDAAAAKGTRGGFAVSGRTSNKGGYEIVNINADSTRFYIDASNSKATRGGFAVSGRTSNKGPGEDILKITPELTEVFVSEPAAKSTRGGFAVSGRTSNKAGGTFDIMHVQPKSTDIYIKADSTSKSFPDGFTISGYNQGFDPTQLFSVSQLGTIVNTSLSVAPKVNTYDVTTITQTKAYSGGAVIDSNDVAITAVGIIYNQTGDLNITIDFSIPSVAGQVFGNPALATDFPSLVMNSLLPGVSYQVRAFATNAEGLTGYGPIKIFTTATK